MELYPVLYALLTPPFQFGALAPLRSGTLFHGIFLPSFAWRIFSFMAFATSGPNTSSNVFPFSLGPDNPLIRVGGYLFMPISRRLVSYASLPIEEGLQ